MKVMRKDTSMDYFEKVYLGKGKKGNNISATESKRLQKLLSANALASSVDSRGMDHADFKRTINTDPVLTTAEKVDFESIVNPFEHV